MQPFRSARRSHRVVLLVALLTIVAGCGGGVSPAPTGIAVITLVAGPTCPVERFPPDPNCAPKPVGDETIVILTLDQREIARGRSDADGRIRFSLPYGHYLVRGLADPGFPIPPADQPVDVGAAPVDVTLEYDTGIR